MRRASQSPCLTRPSQIISRELPLGQAADAYDKFDRHADGYTKVILHPAGRPDAGAGACDPARSEGHGPDGPGIRRAWRAISPGSPPIAVRLRIPAGPG